TFWQDCGRRLKPQRAVAPTPPNGIPRAEAPAPAAPRPAAPAPAAVPIPLDRPRSTPGARPAAIPREEAPREEAQVSQRRSRPEAPAFSFAQAAAPAGAARAPGAKPAPQA